MRHVLVAVGLTSFAAPLMGQGLFGPQQTISTNADYATSVYAADVDGDGDIDALSASFYDDKIAWYENTDGLGTFGPEQIISTNADAAWDVYAADVDDDGDMDVLSASGIDNKIAWYENTDGLGTFGPEQIISTNADGAFSVFAADVDGDGDVDVLSASLLDNKIAWYENTDGLGSFGAQQIISTNADGAYSVYAADVDGDGDVDVLSASGVDNKIAWYENTDGIGTFGAQQVISTNANAALSVYAADVDGDGDVDVLSASLLDDKIAWYENTDGLGTFGAQQIISTNADGAQSVYAADVDGDGDVDVLSASRNDFKIAWYENTDGLGTFGAEQIISTNALGAFSVYAADVDGDGDVDALSASANDSKIAWYENLSAPTPAVLGDGCGDLAPTFPTQSVISDTADGARSVYTADVDGDGDLDVLSASSETLYFTVTDDEIAWFENTDGLGTFGAPRIFATSTNGARSVYAADVDGDGDLDVLSASQYDDKIAWYENIDGLGTFGAQQVITNLADGARSVFAADVDGDGDVDVISASTFDSTIAWFENTDGLGNFGPQQIISSNAGWAYSVYAVDVDGDGDIDVLSASRFDNKIAWYENTDGLGNFAEQAISTSAAGANSVFAADVDGDGDVDVLSASDLDDKIAWYENVDGLGGFGVQRVISNNANGVNSVFAADVNGDGDVDVLSASGIDDKIFWYENTDGIGSFGAQQVISTSVDRPEGVYAADVDSDGDIDVLSASYDDNKIAWYPNDPTPPLTLVADALQIGGQWSLRADNVAGVFSAFVFGDAAFDPGISLAPFGAPGCSAHTTPNLGAFVQIATNGTSTLSLSVPTNPALVGYQVSAQSTCAASNALGLATSNGLRATVGL